MKRQPKFKFGDKLYNKKTGANITVGSISKEVYLNAFNTTFVYQYNGFYAESELTLEPPKTKLYAFEIPRSGEVRFYTTENPDIVRTLVVRASQYDIERDL